MPSERAITQMVDVFTDVIDLGGTEERTAVVPNLSVIDAAPTGLTNFIIVQDDRDGDNILAKTVPGVVYTNSDKVNVLFIRGAEPIAFQQGSESPNAGLWEITPSTSTDIFYDKGQVGIGENTPRDQLTISKTGSDGGIGISTTTTGNPYIDFEDAGTLKANLFWNRTANVFEVNNAGDTLFAGTSGNVGIGLAPTNKFEVISGATTDSIAHFGEVDGEGGYLTSTADHQIILSGGAEFVAGSWTARATDAALMATDTGALTWFTNAGLVDGNVFVPTERMRLDTSGNLGVGTAGPDAKLDVLATTTQLRLTHTDGSKFVDFTLDTNHDLTITPSSTGQVIFQPTTDSTDFFQVLDADGGTPVLNVDSTNERVGIGVAAPLAPLDVNGDMLLSGGSQNYLFTDRTTALEIQSQSPATQFSLELFSNDGDGTDTVTFNLYGVGTPSSITNRERLLIRYNSGGPNLEMFTEANGTGTLRPLIIYTEGNSNQLYLDTDGDVGVGSSTTSGKLHIDQASTTGAKPVAYFDQADVSEEMFQFATTIGVGNAIEAVGAKTLTTTHFIKVTIPGGLTRYFPVGTIA